jgi:hypothetical protein
MEEGKFTSEELGESTNNILWKGLFITFGYLNLFRKSKIFPNIANITKM